MIPNWKFIIADVPITVGTSAYTAGDVVGGTLTSAALPLYEGCGELAWVRLSDAADQKEAYTLYVYNSNPSVIADDAAFAPTVADWAKTLGRISIAAADYDASGSYACAFSDAIDTTTLQNIPFDSLAKGVLYFRLVAIDTPDYAAATDLVLSVGMWVA